MRNKKIGIEQKNATELHICILPSVTGNKPIPHSADMFPARRNVPIFPSPEENKRLFLTATANIIPPSPVITRPLLKRTEVIPRAAQIGVSLKEPPSSLSQFPVQLNEEDECIETPMQINRIMGENIPQIPAMCNILRCRAFIVTAFLFFFMCLF
jgi:hypothetical protein